MAINKELVKGSTSILVLSLLARTDMYGYQIIQEIASRSNDMFKLNEGTLYPILHTMLKEGMLECYKKDSELGRERKYYRITTAGKAILVTKMEEWTAFFSAVNGVLKEDV